MSEANVVQLILIIFRTKKKYDVDWKAGDVTYADLSKLSISCLLDPWLESANTMESQYFVKMDQYSERGGGGGDEKVSVFGNFVGFNVCDNYLSVLTR